MNELLSAKIMDKVRRTRDKNVPAALGFLDPSEQVSANEILQRCGARYFFSGGYKGAERAFLFLLPDYLKEEHFPISDYIKAFSATVPFGKPTHRDFLGSILGLGIERECVGDILVGEESVFLLDSKISPFIGENLKKIGRQGVFLKEIELDDIKPVNEPFDEVNTSVASLRLDALTAAAFHVSRSIAADAISGGAVSKNWIVCENPATELCEDDLISWRGHGRARLANVGGMSKKGRQFVTFHVYIKKK